MPRTSATSAAAPLRQLVPPAWRPALAAVLEGAALEALDHFLGEDARKAPVLPPRERLFAALEHTPPSAVRAVLLGQDPYPTPGNANGLAFSVAPGVKVPASLRNLLKGLEVDLGLPVPAGGDLTPWARAGVLLLNTVLSVRAGAAGSHRRRGWEALTGAALAAVAASPEPVVFFCLGKEAQAVVAAVAPPPRHLVVATPHPSPLTGGAFLEAVRRERPFSRANAFLTASGRLPLDFRLGPAAGQDAP